MSVFSLDSWLTLIPVVHGSAAYASALRKELLSRSFDALAVPLPASFSEEVIRGVERLPALSVVVRLACGGQVGSLWSDSQDQVESSERIDRGTYVPIDPCQGVIAAIRMALGERLAIEWIDGEGDQIESHSPVIADCYAIRHTTLERFCSAMLPAIPPPSLGLASSSMVERIETMAGRILAMRGRHRRIVALCPLEAWPWLREAIRSGQERSGGQEDREDSKAHESQVPELFRVDPRSYLFMLGELPFITGLIEQARQDFEDDDRVVAEGLKELFVTARSSYRQELGNRARQITPLLISQCLKYVRNQTLLDRRMTPSFYTLAKSAQQMMGDTYTAHLVNSATEYRFDSYEQSAGLATIRMGIGVGDLPDSGPATLVSRLPGPPMQWHSLELKRPVQKKDQRRWESRWNPYMQCSWPEEDTQIESFRNRVAERARQILGADLARTEKFTTSIMDGLDLRETLRHWYDGSLYVKVNPPSVGQVNVTVMIFDPEPDPREYTWRATWFAEHPDESTLAFFATPFDKQMIGPGIAMATYGGSMFIYPPRPIVDIWQDERLDFTDTLEQRLVAAACLHSESRHVALMSPTPPGQALKKIAKRYSCKLVHVPLAHFSDSVIQQLRVFHVLNGRQVRSYAADFIRKS
ncbi:MAG: hypothetical protein NTV29_07755 [Planctomycetota bacterium]|nr:hypothetical protein [Planctomycetota bacterium]